MPGVFAECDDGRLDVIAGRLRVRVVGRVEFPVLVPLQGTGALLLRRSPCCLDGDKLRPRGEFAVDVRCHLRLEAWSVKTLVALHVRKQARVETAATWAGDTGSSFRPERGVLSVERCFGKVQIKTGLYPRAQMLRGEQVGFLVLPVFAPAVLERRILSEELYEAWPQINDGQTYIVDVGIACVGMQGFVDPIAASWCEFLQTVPRGLR